jgi:xanthine dehydrogenase accessory factor
LDKIHAPIGLPIKAETPEELAISILAELIAVEKGADLDTLRLPFYNTIGSKETSSVQN